MWKSSAHVILSDLRENAGFMGHTASDEALQHPAVRAYVQPAIGDVMSFSDSYRYIHSFCLSYLLFVCLKKKVGKMASQQLKKCVSLWPLHYGWWLTWLLCCLFVSVSLWECFAPAWLFSLKRKAELMFPVVRVQQTQHLRSWGS